MKTILTTLITALTFAAFAQEPAAKATPKPHTGPRAMSMQGSIEPVVRAALNPKVAAKVGLTEEQTAKLKALATNRDANKALQEKVRKGMEKQAELLKAEKIDEAAVMAALDEVWDAKKEIAKLQTKRVIAVREILTPEQVKGLRQALETLKSTRGEQKRPQGPKAQGKKPGKAAKAEQGQD